MKRAAARQAALETAGRRDGVTILVQQIALFATDIRRTLVDDGSGLIYYVPGVVDAEHAAAWSAELQASIEWHHQRRPMYDRVVDVPRLTSSFGPGDDLPPVVRAAKDAVEEVVGTSFNSVGLNLYRDGSDSVAMHNDHRSELIPGSPVALLSLGAPRVMRVHSKNRPRRTFAIPLEPGSVFVMSGASQENWEHGIPKTRDVVGPRISLAFRLRPPASGSSS